VSLVQTEEKSAFGSALATTSSGDLLVGASDVVYVVPGAAFGL